MISNIALIFLPLIGLICGILLANTVHFSITEDISVFLAVGLMVTVDLLFDGTARFLNEKFQLKASIFSYLLNLIFAYFLLTLGYLMHVDLYIALFIVFGIKLFSNLSYISQRFFSKLQF